VNIVKTGLSALSKLLVAAGFAAMFLVGLVGVVYMSLQGKEVSVPEIIGKDYAESEKELASLGLKIKRRADRFSDATPNTVIEQLPHPGETVKTGQMILVVVSKQNPDGQETPTTLHKSDEDDTEKIEEMISDKPKKSRSGSNSNKKKPDTSRDAIDNTSTSNSQSDTDSDAKKADRNNSGDKGNKAVTNPGSKNNSPAANKTIVIKPATGEPRPRSTPKQ
jgi:hypothetical protein